MVEMQTDLLEMVQAKIGELTEKSTFAKTHSVDTFLSFIQNFGSAEDAALAEEIAQIDSIKALGWFLVKNNLDLSPKVTVPSIMLVEEENTEMKKVSSL